MSGGPFAHSVVLALDASTSRATVALVRGREVLAAAETAGGRDERLLPVIIELLGHAELGVGDVAGVVCGAGPGSFTGLRVAGSIAKGLALGGGVPPGRGVPLSAVSSLLLIVAGLPEAPPAGRYLAAIDAMRGERFVATVTVDGPTIALASAPCVVSAQDAVEMAAAGGAQLIGPGCPWDAWPHVRGIVRLGPDSVIPVDIDAWEPSYGRQSAAEDRRAKV